MGTMPVTLGAIRKLRADKRKAVVNMRVKIAYKRALSEARKKINKKSLTTAFSKLDKAVKAKVIVKNKASRLKSRLSKLLKS